MLDKQEQSIKKCVKSEIQNLKLCIDRLSAEFSQMKQRQDGMEKKTSQLEQSVRSVSASFDAFDNKLDKLEGFSRRDNLRFFGVPETGTHASYINSDSNNSSDSSRTGINNRHAGGVSGRVVLGNLPVTCHFHPCHISLYDYSTPASHYHHIGYSGFRCAYDHHRRGNHHHHHHHHHHHISDSVNHYYQYVCRGNAKQYHSSDTNEDYSVNSDYANRCRDPVNCDRPCNFRFHCCWSRGYRWYRLPPEALP
nr:hypothetical protein BaRGS_030122 [Batillaria attramentaria]